MKIKLLLAGSLALLCQAAFAQNLPIVQTQNFSFVPDDNEVLIFNQFDSMGGTRTLTAITIQVEYTKIGGRLEVDNDSENAGSINLTHRIVGSISSGDVGLVNNSFQPIFATGSLNATSELFSQPIGATTGDPTNSFNNTGLGDYFLYEPGNVSVDQTRSVGSLAFGGYIGLGTYDLTFDGLQTTSVTGLGGLAQAFVPSSVSGSITVSYEYIPEPSSALLLGVGALGLMLRRRRS